jgi:AAA15 family ATPase/GTPase
MMISPEAKTDALVPSMLLAFRVENSRSFRDEAELSMLGTRLSGEDVVRKVPWREKGRPINVLPLAGIFGANASGKSNFLEAMHDMRTLVMGSFKQGTPGEEIERHPYLLGADEGRAPTSYQVDLVLGGVRHEYGFRVDSNAVLEEWGRSYPRGRAVQLFHRIGDDVNLGTAQRGKGRATQEILRSNALFLSTAAATNHPLLLPIFEWFERNLIFADVESRHARQILTADLLEQDEHRDQLLSLLREADLGITDVSRQLIDPDMKGKIEQFLNIMGIDEMRAKEGEEGPFEMPDLKQVKLKHRSSGEDVELESTEESRGTMVWFGLIGLVVEALKEGSVLLADELEASLHPTLVKALVNLFQSKRSNPNRAQLIFNSHQVTLMGDSGEGPLGRDQIWFSEKNEDGSTRLYPLTDLGPRKDEAIGRRYLKGRYGATPIISVRQLEEIVAPELTG